jgi:hypothetical protein
MAKLLSRNNNSTIQQFNNIPIQQYTNKPIPSTFGILQSKSETLNEIINLEMIVLPEKKNSPSGSWKEPERLFEKLSLRNYSPESKAIAAIKP